MSDPLTGTENILRPDFALFGEKFIKKEAEMQVFLMGTLEIYKEYSGLADIEEIFWHVMCIKYDIKYLQV